MVRLSLATLAPRSLPGNLSIPHICHRHLVLDGGPHDPRGFQALVVGSKSLMVDGRREDVRSVWDALPQGSHLMLLNPWMLPGGMLPSFGKVAEREWMRLERYLDTENLVEGQNENAEN